MRIEECKNCLHNKTCEFKIRSATDVEQVFGISLEIVCYDRDVYSFRVVENGFVIGCPKDK